MLDIAISYNKYKFLGKEFLTWLWFSIENDHNFFGDYKNGTAVIEIGNRIVLEKHRKESDRQETITIKGDDASLDEGIIALRKGAVVAELNIVYKAEDNIWQFTIKGESLHITGLKTPETGTVTTEDDLEGAILEKVYLYDLLLKIIDKSFFKFIKIRLSEKWKNEELIKIKNWIYA